ncbi:MAG: hypothetical protein KBG29_13960, partial [Pseudomonadales bacterium]|nr:hypothetical protein [Pseudomonadales bacterium]
MNNAIQLKAADAFASAHGYSASVVRLRNTSDVSIDYSVSGGDAVELAAGASAVIDVAALTSEISVRRTDLSTTPVDVMLEFGLDPDEAYVFAVENAPGSITSVASADITDAGTAGKAVLVAETPAQVRAAAGLGSVENTALSTWAGSTNLDTVGTVTTGTWHGSAIADTYISSAAAWNAKVSFPGFGATAGTAAEGNDARLSDARTPLAHTQAWSTITTTPTTLAGYGITDAQGLDSDLTALAGLSTTGLVARTGSGTAATRTITGTADQVTVTNGDGVSGNPTLSLPQSIATTSTPQFAQIGLGAAADDTYLLNLNGALVHGTSTGVGIGTTAPTAKLEVAYNGAASLRVGIHNNASNTTVQVLKSLTAVGYDATAQSTIGAVAFDYYNDGVSPSWTGTLLTYDGPQANGSAYGFPRASSGVLVFQNTQNGIIAGIMESDPNDAATFETFKSNGLDIIEKSG